MERGNGILLHISSLPSAYGYGCISKEAYEFVDNLYKANQKYWQILPLNMVDNFGSPYSSVSQFAFNPLLIDLEEFYSPAKLKKMGFRKGLPSAEYEILKTKALNDICENVNFSSAIDKFVKENEFWIKDFAIFMALKEKFGTFDDFDEEYKDKSSDKVKSFSLINRNLINKYITIQYIFYKQWKELKDYANSKNIKIIGDMPIYCSIDSADVWSNINNFLLDKNYQPLYVAGVPGDYFNKNGQRWGNPIYNYQYMEASDFKWWVERINHLSKVYDYIKIDHFRAFAEYYSIPADEIDANKGEWKKGVGHKLFGILKQNNVLDNLILEDLGVIDEKVIKLKKDYKLPGMKIFEFAFDGDEKNLYLPNTYEKNCVAYLGTHDNNTFDGFLNANEHTKELVCKYLFLPINCENNLITFSAIEKIVSSNADIVILRTQDLLCEDETKRINTPGTTENNWKYQIQENQINKELIEYLRNITIKYNRK